MRSRSLPNLAALGLLEDEEDGGERGRPPAAGERRVLQGAEPMQGLKQGLDGLTALAAAAEGMGHGRAAGGRGGV